MGVASAVAYADDMLDNYLWPKNAPASGAVTRDQVRSLLILAYNAGQNAVISQMTDEMRNYRLIEAEKISGNVTLPDPIGA